MAAGTVADTEHGLREQSFELRGGPVRVSNLLRDLWRSRRLLVILARQEFFVRYRRASFGLLWAVVLPLVQAVVLAVVLSHFVRFHTGTNFAVFIFAGTVAFTFFSTGISAGVSSIVDGQTLSTRIYFPRALFPLVAVGAGVYGLCLSSIVLVALGIGLGAALGPNLVLLIPAAVVSVALTATMSLVFAVLQVYFRDLRHLVQAALIAWFYVTPIFYPLSAIGRFRPLVEANPATGMVELYRGAVGTADPGWLTSLWWTLGWTGALAIAALLLYRRYDRICVDLL